MAFFALFFQESSKQTSLQPDSGVYSIETSEARDMVGASPDRDSSAAGRDA
jgi:hypothetical protein